MVNRGDGQGRSAKNVTEVRALFVDLDGAPMGPLLQCSPAPHAIIESSPGRWHGYWLVENCPLDQFRSAQLALAKRFHGDESVNDLPRVMRLPGFIHRKARPFRSRIVDMRQVQPYEFEEVKRDLLRGVPQQAPPSNNAIGPVQAQAHVAAGGRHSHLTRIFGMLNSRGLALDAVAAALHAENVANCRPPLPDDEVEALIRDMARRYAAEHGSAPAKLEMPAWSGPAISVVGADWIDADPGMEEFIIGGLLPVDAIGFIGTGGAGKSTLLQWIAIHIILGRAVFGAPVLRSGAVLIISAEDRCSTIKRRLHHLCSALDLTRAEREQVARSVYIEDVSGRDVRLVEDVFGHVAATSAVRELIDKYTGTDLAVVVSDPVSLLGAGERCGNDGMSELMRASRRISEQLHCAVINVHHESKAGNREGMLDQFAGRGGAAFADNARGIMQLVPAKSTLVKYEGRDWCAPVRWGCDVADAGELMALLLHKLSAGPREHAPIFVRRQGWHFDAEHALRADGEQARQAKRTAHQQQILDFVSKKLGEAPPMRYSPTSLAKAGIDYGIGDHAARVVIEELVQKGLLVEQPLPSGELRGSRKTYLVPRDTLQRDL
jgi:hypothetical protein